MDAAAGEGGRCAARRAGSGAAGIRMLYPDASGPLTARHINQPFAAHTP
ncbi:hypothetical protein [Streptomyces purpurascens]|uniref:Uncharacterized protein n=1 Tax=Streptomyces purpurascens TaxID=1924 RepID=A0ABZ1MXT4_STREF|nr:hypothetical protein [Streptomyces purpurascens]MCE7049649.1 hypothetical protein [Streptomyces purpurascens]GHA44373.1 hypothetical protein GCM10010303_64330 [Streptomyces purpurascens]